MKKRSKETDTPPVDPSPTTEVLSEAVTPHVENKEERNANMFLGWLLGKTYVALAKEYNLSYNTVCDISKKDNWAKLKRELRVRRYKEAMSEARGILVSIQNVLKDDIFKIVEDVKKTDRMLTKEERDHLRACYDRILKEIRLDNDQPTELPSNNSPARVEISLPPGARHYGLVPPSSNVRYVEQQKAEEKKDKIDLDQIEAELGREESKE